MGDSNYLHNWIAYKRTRKLSYILCNYLHDWIAYKLTKKLSIDTLNLGLVRYRYSQQLSSDVA